MITIRLFKTFFYHFLGGLGALDNVQSFVVFFLMASLSGKVGGAS